MNRSVKLVSAIFCLIVGLVAAPSAQARYPTCSCGWCAMWPGTTCDVNSSGPPLVINCNDYQALYCGGPIGTD
jgi:hypothetical protein